MPLRRFSTIPCILALAAASAIAASPALADDTTAAIKKAEALYRKGSLGKAFTQVEAAATQVADQLAEQIGKSFPPAPAGWRRERPGQGPVKSLHRVGRGLHVRRHYIENGGRGVAAVQVFIDNQEQIDWIKHWGSDEARAKGTKSALVPITGAGNAFVQFNRWRESGYVTIFLAGRISISASGNKLKDRAFLTNLLSKWDFAGLKRTVGAK